ncbi:MAG: LysR family transcriptional regulator [Myxococcales bacterium]|nr:LysR family transcriptional regulator [Myxococcales bacterium]
MLPLPELRLADLMTLLAVQRTGTISGAARELRVTPSQVSKAVSRLERHYGLRLLSRGARGVAPTPAARRMLPRIANAVEELRGMNGARGEQQAPEVELSVAGPSYLIAQVLPTLVGLVERTRVRGLELAPAYLRAYIADNAFDAALAPGGIHHRPASWTSAPCGEIRSALVARPSFAKQLEPLPLTADRVRALPFIAPTTAGADRLVTIGDDCPIPREERIVAHEIQMVGAALEFVSRGDYVCFCPVLACRRYFERGELVELPVVGWDVREPLYVLCNGDRVPPHARAALECAVQAVAGSTNGVSLLS